MLTSVKVAVNLKELKSRIPTKPLTYTTDHPKSIKEALIYYCNRRTVHIIQACTANLNEDNWPLPLWVDTRNVRVGFWNKIYYSKFLNSGEKWKFRKLKEFDSFSVFMINHICFKISFDEVIPQAFDANKKYAFQMLLSSEILKSKIEIINSIRQSYNQANWIACISTLFPLVDFVTRKFLRTTNLSVDVSRICKVFSQNGLSLENADDLMPHITFVRSHKSEEPFFSKERKEWREKMNETDFGIIGPPLSSFIRFANIYYSYYKEDIENISPQILNRHAILHGSTSGFGTKANAVRLITFLYLMIELEDVFTIVLSE